MATTTNQHTRVKQAIDLTRDIAATDSVPICHYPDVNTLDTVRPGETAGGPFSP